MKNRGRWRADSNGEEFSNLKIWEFGIVRIWGRGRKVEAWLERIGYRDIEIFDIEIFDVEIFDIEIFDIEIFDIGI